MTQQNQLPLEESVFECDREEAQQIAERMDTLIAELSAGVNARNYGDIMNHTRMIEDQLQQLRNLVWKKSCFDAGYSQAVREAAQTEKVLHAV